ncbi:MAG: hypothetical protein OXE84_07990 [Rhodobacteraceae bacterium]|nr:hypothetical protein [Paracoccaceae bacterium]MCY4327641.1 hypothetical protein [Paracoccaceae bacterium]
MQRQDLAVILHRAEQPVRQGELAIDQPPVRLVILTLDVVFINDVETLCGLDPAGADIGLDQRARKAGQGPVKAHIFFTPFAALAELDDIGGVEADPRRHHLAPLHAAAKIADGEDQQVLVPDRGPTTVPRMNFNFGTTA